MKKLTALLLLGCILLTSLCGLAGCKNRDGEDAGRDPYSEQTGEFDEWGRPMIHSPLSEELYYEGEKLRVLSRNTVLSAGQFVEATEQPSVLNEAIFARNAMIKDRLGVDIEHIGVDGGNWNANLNGIIRKQVESGLNDYDLVANFAYYGSALAISGYYYDWNKIDNVYTDQSYWNQSFIKETQVGNKLYMVVNDSNLSCAKNTFVTFFNKPLVETWCQGVDLYSVVDEGEWTLEYFSTLLKDIYEDDGSNTRNEADFYGLITSVSSQNTDPYFAASGLRVCTFNSDGMPEMSINTDSTITAFELVYELLHNNTGVYVNGSTTPDFVAAGELFANEKSVFTVCPMDCANDFVDKISGKFGVVPVPKLDSEDEYKTTAQDSYDFLCVPGNTSKERADMVGAVTEYMAYVSYMKVMPVYFENITKLRYSSESADARMFDEIMDDVSFDFGMIYSASIEGDGVNAGHFWSNIFKSNSKAFSSQYAINGKLYESQLQDLLDFLLE